MSKQLIEAQRYGIYLGLQRKWTQSQIAKDINVSESTVSREIARNSNENGEYCWIVAQKKADSRKHGLSGNHRKSQELWWRIDQMIIEEDWFGEFLKRKSMYELEQKGVLAHDDYSLTWSYC